MQNKLNFVWQVVIVLFKIAGAQQKAIGIFINITKSSY